MDHVVYTDAKSQEMEKILKGEKTMIIRGATGRKLPYGKVNTGDRLYLINNNGEGTIKASCRVKSVFNSDKMSKEESMKLVADNALKLNLSKSQYSKWAGKRYIVLIEIDSAKEVTSLRIDKSKYSNMDDWLPVVDIESVKIK